MSASNATPRCQESETYQTPRGPFLQEPGWASAVARWGWVTPWRPTMKRLAIIALPVVLAAGLASAAELAPNDNSKSQGSGIGQASSAVTGNGAAIGGGTNGTGQTTAPGTRADE